MSDPVKINLKINGKDTSLVVAPQTSLLRALRDAYYWEVKCGCEEGDCGTCTILLDGVSVKSCVTLATACNGHEVWTNKGLGYNTELTAKLQKNFVECGAVQCGFCTPGMIVAGTYYLKSDGRPDRKVIKKAMSGNLCRCTGYVKIIDAIYKTAIELKSEASQ
ncbi:MAG: (2Fe-2S)-binding protein [Smithella sp.]